MSMNTHSQLQKQRTDARRATTASATSEAPKSSGAGANAKAGSGNPDDIRINGFEQVLAMLEAADPTFRESLLRRLAQRDPLLVRQLRNKLGY